MHFKSTLVLFSLTITNTQTTHSNNVNSKLPQNNTNKSVDEISLDSFQDFSHQDDDSKSESIHSELSISEDIKPSLFEHSNSNIYSLGLIFWSIFTEQLPYSASCSDEIVKLINKHVLPSIDDDLPLKDLITSCLLKVFFSLFYYFQDPFNRLSIEEVIQELEARV